MLRFLSAHDWLGHIVEALVMAAIVAAVNLLVFDWKTAIVIGCVGAGQHFYGREKRDCEVRTKMAAPHLKAYWPGYWNKDELTDFFPVVAVMLIIIGVVRFVL
jgi:hypothetical protein